MDEFESLLAREASEIETLTQDGPHDEVAGGGEESRSVRGRLAVWTQKRKR